MTGVIFWVQNVCCFICWKLSGPGKVHFCRYRCCCAQKVATLWTQNVYVYTFIHLKFMLYLLHRLVEWCDSYCKLKRDPAKPMDHQIFYASCQVCCGCFCMHILYLAKQEKLVWYLCILNCSFACSIIRCSTLNIYLLFYLPCRLWCMSFAFGWDLLWTTQILNHSFFKCQSSLYWWTDWSL